MLAVDHTTHTPTFFLGAHKVRTTIVLVDVDTHVGNATTATDRKLKVLNVDHFVTSIIDGLII